MLICPKCQSVFPPGTHSRCPNDDALLYALGDDDGGPREALGPGSTIAQKYELLEVIPHRTGTGRTFKARQLRLKRDVELRGLGGRLPSFAQQIDYGQLVDLILANKVINFA